MSIWSNGNRTVHTGPDSHLSYSGANPLKSLQHYTGVTEIRIWTKYPLSLLVSPEQSVSAPVPPPYLSTVPEMLCKAFLNSFGHSPFSCANNLPPSACTCQAACAAFPWCMAVGCLPTTSFCLGSLPSLIDCYFLISSLMEKRAEKWLNSNLDFLCWPECLYLLVLFGKIRHP